MFGKRKATVKKSYDKEEQRPVIKCSICTGEQVAGFINKKTGKFQEVMLVKDETDLKLFKDMYGLEDVEKVY
ncbi:MAG: aspartate dehydrogenase [Lachnospiraceae bacterium]|nr:aspartate dehydrogenase [Lachnospiraceae bacterium]